MASKNDTPAISSFLQTIEQANDLEISEILKAVIRRYRKIHPDWEVAFLSLPTNNPKERRKILRRSMAMFRKYSGQ